MTFKLPVALAAMLETAGYKTRVRVVAVKPNRPDEYSHAIALMQNPDTQKWIPLDIGQKGKPGDYPEERVAGHRDYEVPI